MGTGKEKPRSGGEGMLHRGREETGLGAEQEALGPAWGPSPNSGVVLPPAPVHPDLSQQQTK